MKRILIILLILVIFISGCDMSSNADCRMNCARIKYGCEINNFDIQHIENCVSGYQKEYILKQCLDLCIDSDWRN